MKFFYRVPYLLLLVILSSGVMGQTQKMVQFNLEKPELISTKALDDFLNSVDPPKIVIRSTEVEYDASLYDMNYLYNIIEKEFLKGGFSVKDRALYEEVVSRTEEDLDYTILKNKTDTDLIFEIVKLDTDLDYITNSYFNNKGVKTVLYKDGEVHVKGARVEIKLILVERNEIVGNYVFHYAPCCKGCPIRLRDYEVIFEDGFSEKLPKKTYKVVT
jgi:hypothetical protein